MEHLVCSRLTDAGFYCQPAEVAVEPREDRWLVRLPGQRLAWFAASDEGLERLRTERRVLRLLESRCSFAAPRVLYESDDGRFDVRSMVPGMPDPWTIYSELHGNSEVAGRLGASIGTILAEQHSRIAAADVSTWLPHRVCWPESREWIRERLPRVTDDQDLIARADAVIDACEHVSVDEADRALVHTDVGFHNLAIDAGTRTACGVFDYEAAAWADRHHDFRYLVFSFEGSEVLDAAISTYQKVISRPIRCDRVHLYNAACAISFLAYRAGTQAADRWCGRTLAEDLQWTRHAMNRCR
jgi:aminoglycoside phosphotransferase (APT) family kinase protein